AAWSAGFEPHVAEHEQLSGLVRFESSPVAVDGDEEDHDDFSPGPANSHEAFVAQRIGELHRQLQTRTGPRRTIGVLTRGNKLGNRLLYELRRQGLPASGEGGNPIADTPAVAAVLSAIDLSDHPGDTAAAFHVLNSPMAPIIDMASRRDAARVAARVRRVVLRDGWAATVADWVTALAPACDAAGLAKLTKLVGLVEQYEAQNTGASAEAFRGSSLVEFIEGAKVEEPSTSSIRVMTIHRSKGLEFDAVVLPELDGRFNNNFEVLIDRPDPTGPIEGVFRGVKEANRSIDPALVRAYTRQRARQRQEDFCTLYVAMTRAKRALHLIAKPATTPDGKPRRVGLCFAGLLRDTLGDPDGDAIEWGEADWAGPVGASPDDEHQLAAESSASPAVLSVRLSHRQAPQRNRAAVSPSQLHAQGKVSARELLDLQSTAARQRGTDLHALLERVDYFDPAESNDELPPVLRPMFEHADVRAALSRRFGDGETLWRERGFVVPDGPRMLKGKFDRVALNVDASGRVKAAHLIDFKTDRIAADHDALRQRADHYRGQMEAYRRALSLMLGLDASAITAELLFTTPGVAIEV
ncbi:MAG: 3'-5' exonuclease, partial [Planctomycetota bacterium]